MLKEIYFDHASTSYPKPFTVLEEIENYLKNIGVSPGRSSYKRAQAAEEVVFETRGLIAALINAESPYRIIFTLNATHALNIAIKGTLSAGDHVVTTDWEHNAVLRPLETLKQAGMITYDVVCSDDQGKFVIEDFERYIKSNTRVIIVNHGSNVLGSVISLEQIGDIAKRHNILFIVDGSQTAGLIDIDVKRCNIDFLAFTGHKSLLGPSGTGGLYVKYPEKMKTLYEGGTGLNSISSLQPETMPAKFEAGTMNYLGIAGLLGSLKYLNNRGRAELYKENMAITNYCLAKLQEMSEIVIYGSVIGKELPIVSFNVKNGLPQEIAYLLDNEHNIMVRSGLHCAPLIHKALKTFPHGTVRISFGCQNSFDHIDIFINALKNIISCRYS